MTTQEIKQRTQEVFDEIWHKGNLDVLDELIRPDEVTHVPGWGELKGPEGFRQMATALRSAFPDIRYTIEDQIVEDDRIAARWTMRGTHEGELLGIPPTNEQVKVTGITMGRISPDPGGVTWIESDMLGLLQQIGAVPEQAGATSARS